MIDSDILGMDKSKLRLLNRQRNAPPQIKGNVVNPEINIRKL
jgi:hypothetical protein